MVVCFADGCGDLFFIEGEFVGLDGLVAEALVSVLFEFYDFGEGSSGVAWSGLVFLSSEYDEHDGDDVLGECAEGCGVGLVESYHGSGGESVVGGAVHEAHGGEGCTAYGFVSTHLIVSVVHAVNHGDD